MEIWPDRIFLASYSPVQSSSFVEKFTGACELSLIASPQPSFLPLSVGAEPRKVNYSVLLAYSFQFSIWSSFFLFALHIATQYAGCHPPHWSSNMGGGTNLFVTEFT